MPSFDDLYDQLLAFVGKEGLLSDFSQLQTDRERAEAILSLDFINEYVVAPSFRRKSESEAEHVLQQADTCSSHDELGSALRLYSTAARLCPADSPTLMHVYQRRGALLHRLGHHEATLEDAARVVDMSPSTEATIKCKQLVGSCYQLQGRWQEAEKEFQLALKTLRESQLSNEIKASLAGEIIQGLKQTKLNMDGTKTLPEKVENSALNRRPEVDFGKHAQIPSCSAAVSLEVSPEKGRHLVANTDIKIGSVLIVEEPFAWSLCRETISQHCLHCCRLVLAPIPCSQCSTVNFCSPTCRDLAWTSYHRFECPVLDHFLATSQLSVMALLVYRTVVAAALHDERGDIDVEFTRLHSDDTASATSNYGPTFHQLTNSSSRTPGDLLKRTLTAVFLLRCLQNVVPNIHDETTFVTAFLRHMQSCSCNAYQMNEQLVPGGDVRHAEGVELGGAVYPTISFCNHSCYPNMVRHSYGRACVMRAIRPLRCGEELTDNYGPHFLSHTLTDRQEVLKKQYSFHCDCLPCTDKWPTGDLLHKRKSQYKCINCENILGYSLIACNQCNNKFDVKKTSKQLQDMTEKYKSAIQSLLNGRVAECLEICEKYATFLEMVVVQPNIELIRCQQTIIQCWSLMGNVDNRTERGENQEDP